MCHFNGKKDSSGHISRNGGPSQGLVLTLRHFVDERDARTFQRCYDGASSNLLGDVKLETVLRYNFRNCSVIVYECLGQLLRRLLLLLVRVRRPLHLLLRRPSVAKGLAKINSCILPFWMIDLQTFKFVLCIVSRLRLIVCAVENSLNVLKVVKLNDFY